MRKEIERATIKLGCENVCSLWGKGGSLPEDGEEDGSVERVFLVDVG